MWGREEEWLLKESGKGPLHRQEVPREQTVKGAILRGRESGVGRGSSLCGKWGREHTGQRGGQRGREHGGQQGGSTEDSGEDSREGAQRTEGMTAGWAHRGQWGGSTEGSGADSGSQGMCAASSPHPCLQTDRTHLFLQSFVEKITRLQIIICNCAQFSGIPLVTLAARLPSST